jgi:solute carrier family 50 protein (sugar transporter)
LDFSSAHPNYQQSKMLPENVITNHLVPLAAAVLANAMYFSPWKTVRQVQTDGVLGQVNPLPYPIAVVAATSWVLYSLALLDYYLYAANIGGLLVNLYFTLLTFPKATIALQRRITIIFLLGFLIQFGAALVDWMVLKGNKNVMGITANVLLMFYYSGPLSTLKTVLRTRNSIYFDPRIAVTATLTSTFFCIYGFALDNLCMM